MTHLLDAARGMADAMPLPKAHEEDRQELRGSVAWLVELRWIAAGAIVASLIAAYFSRWTAHLAWPGLVAAALAGGNLVVWLWLRRGGADATSARLRRVIFLQLVGDMVALALLLHWTGGVLNPFVMLFVFPVSLGAILLPGVKAAICGLLAFLLVTGLVGCKLASTSAPPLFADATGAIPYLEHTTYLLALVTAIGTTLFGLVYFVHAVVRNHHLSEERRRQHERIAQSRERLARVGMIAAGVAHSVRNPLHGVLNCLDLVKHSEDLAEAEEPLELLGEGLSRIEQVTTRLLSFTRDTPLDPVPSDVGPVIEETLGLLEVRMHNRGIRVQTEIGDVPRVRLDPLRLQEALFNVIDNAIAAVDGCQDPRITLRVATVESPFRAVEVCVDDNGVGIASADLALVFDPFFSKKPVGEGTGLGLAITKEVIDAHGGLIRFQSAPNQGTTVSILLPMHSGGDTA